MDLQARALEEGIPYQTLIASVLHKYVSGRLVEKTSPITACATGRTKMLRAGKLLFFRPLINLQPLIWRNDDQTRVVLPTRIRVWKIRSASGPIERGAIRSWSDHAFLAG
jgi:hypothetical protein